MHKRLTGRSALARLSPSLYFFFDEGVFVFPLLSTMLIRTAAQLFLRSLLVSRAIKQSSKNGFSHSLILNYFANIN